MVPSSKQVDKIGVQF